MKRLAWILLAFAPVALAQTPAKTVPAGSNLTLTWTAPTQYTDGSPITDPITYNLYNAGQLIASGLTAPTSTRMNLSAGNPCYTATAVVNGAESDQSSPPYCVAVVKSTKPNAPGPVTSP